jgi:hypothetical protein
LQHLVEFIAHSYDSGFAASTSHVSALGFIFQLGRYPDLTQNFLDKKRLQGFSKYEPSLDTRLPITPRLLTKLVLALLHTVVSLVYWTPSDSNVHFSCLPMNCPVK